MLAALYFPVPARTFSHIRSAHRPLKAQLAGELAVAADEAEKTSIKAEFDARERILEHEVLCRTFAFCVIPALMPPLPLLPATARPHAARACPLPQCCLQLLVQVEWRPRSW